jgi:hypothetical protein
MWPLDVGHPPTNIRRIHRGSRHVSIVFTIASMMFTHFSHNVPYLESKSEILGFIFFHHTTSLQKDLYKSASASNNTYKGLINSYKGYSVFIFFHFSSIILYNYIITEGSKSAISSKQYV